jgi:dienelactone hydrolase
MQKETIRDRLKAFQRLLVALLMFLVGCSAAAQPAPTAIPTPARTATRIIPIPTITRSPITTEEDIYPLEKALEALGSVSSVRIRTTNSEVSGLEPTTPLLTTDMQYSPGPPEQMEVRMDWGDGLVSDLICLGMAQGRQCWSKVGQHPWTVRADLAWIHPWIEQRGQELAATTIISSTILPVSDQMIVAWSRPIPHGVERDQGFETGQTWLQAATYLPIREVVTELSLDEQPLSQIEVIFSDYNAPFAIEAPIAATVTPVPTAPVTPRAPGIDRSAQEETSPFAGVLFAPDRPGPFPGVVVLHGSEGSVIYTKEVARRLAQQGFAALALCYFGCPQTPTSLENIHVEQVMQAVDYLKSRPDIRPEAIGLLGLSRGAELALIVGVLDPDVHAVISVMGVPWVVGGYPTGGTAWLYQGQPLPFRNIPVEQINGPVLVLHGERDIVWPVFSSYLMADRLEAQGHPYEMAVYSDRGHDVGLIPLDAINRMVDFLGRVLP